MSKHNYKWQPSHTLKHNVGLCAAHKFTMTNAVPPDKKRHRAFRHHPPSPPRGLKLSVTTLPTNQRGYQPRRTHSLHAVRGSTSRIRSSSRSLPRRGYLLRAREQGQVWDGGVGPCLGGGGITDPLSPVSPCHLALLWHRVSRAGCVVLASHFRTLHSTHRLAVVTTGASTHPIVKGGALPSRLRVGGTEPRAPSVSIAYVKSHVGCNEAPTIAGTITCRSAERPPRTISTLGVFLKYSPAKTN